MDNYRCMIAFSMIVTQVNVLTLVPLYRCLALKTEASNTKKSTNVISKSILKGRLEFL